MRTEESKIEKINISFSEKDKFNQPGRFVQRKFKSPMHWMINTLDLFKYAPALSGVYFSKTISPPFREMIMLTVAIANDCNV